MLTKSFSPLAIALLVLLASCAKQPYTVVSADAIDGTNAPQLTGAAPSDLHQTDRTDSPESAVATLEQYLCQATLLEPIATHPEEIQVVFLYPQSEERAFLNVELIIDEQTSEHRATFSTAGEDSWWTLPAVRGIAPIVITQWAAIRTPAHELFTLAWSGGTDVNVSCESVLDSL
ncbi:MAG: hypothetical protein AAF152_04545 [Cyanobacteria bacterium P01_A01_bin.114]